jgi:prepilin peptidase CpaA
MSSEKVIMFGILCIAVFFDQRTRKIPNWLVLVGLITAMLLQISASGFAGFKQSLFGAAICLIAFFPFFALRLLGAGDVKLLTAVGAFLGPSQALIAILFTMMAGGVLAVFILTLRGTLKSTLNRMRSAGRKVSELGVASGASDGPPAIFAPPDHPKDRSSRLPYSWAILMGTIGAVYSGW